MRANFYKYTLFFSFLVGCLGVQAQDLLREGEDAFMPDSLYAVRNAIKVDPLQIVFGDFEIFYERILVAGFSIEGGIGITRRNYAAGWFDYSLDNLGRNVDIQSGLAATLAIRKYFRISEEMSGPYLSLGVNQRNYLTSYKVLNETGDLTGIELEDERRFTSGFLNFGVQALPLASNLFVEMYVGLSIRWKDMKVVKSEDVFNPDLYRIDSFREISPGVQAGIKLGLGF